METRLLPRWMYLTITEDNESKYLTVHSHIHINKEVKLNPQYSNEFTNNEIIKDLSSKIYSMFIE